MKTKKIVKKIVKKNPKKTTALAINGGADLQWGSVVSRDSQALQAFCKGVAEVYGVPPMGVNSLAGQPYLNKEGRMFLLSDMRTGNHGLKAIRTEYLQLSTSPDMASICKKTLVFRDGLEIEGIGEASKDNVKLEAVKKTLNMMAETRALNRAIWQTIGGDVWERVAHNLEKKGITDPVITQKVAKAGEVSYEEMSTKDAPAQGKEMTTAEKFQKAKTMIAALKTKEMISTAMGQIRSSDIYTNDQKDKLIQELLKRETEL